MTQRLLFFSSALLLTLAFACPTALAADLDVLQRYRDELDDDNYLHATSLEELRWELEWED